MRDMKSLNPKFALHSMAGKSSVLGLILSTSLQLRSGVSLVVTAGGAVVMTCSD